MSHVKALDVNVELDTYKQYAIEEGGEFLEANHYNWYERHVGDYPIPEGFTKYDLGKCDYKIRFPGIHYEIGIVKNPIGSGYVALYDFWDKQLSEKVGGEKALNMKPKLIAIQAKKAAEKNGLKWKEVKTKKNELRIRTYLK